MPRLSWKLLREAQRLHRCLPLILREVRDLESARSEFRWIQEHAFKLMKRKELLDTKSANGFLYGMCKQRSRGRPLQYILGTQPFGGVDIICQPGVLCPRHETEATVQTLSELLKANTKGKLNILDLCTGPGSIALLLAHNLRGSKILGIDNSPSALRVAERCLNMNTTLGNLDEDVQVSFIKGDLLGNTAGAIETVKSHFGYPTVHIENEPVVDFIIANPPYVSVDSFWRDTARSVRLFEPREALLPPERKTATSEANEPSSVLHEDEFYPVIEHFASALSAKAILVEVGNCNQAKRVEKIWQARNWQTCVWKDYAGIGRNVVAWRENHQGWSWLEI